ncbi:MAG: DsbC family protein [Deltaproteobacteria bacterium]|nr:DsbC family protein [Deltaproteobacteria bacterium]
MKRAILAALVLISMSIVMNPSDSAAFTAGGCGEGACTDCHSLNSEEAAKILGLRQEQILGVEMSPVKGLWEVDVERDGQKWPVYIDFSKDYIVSGQIFQVSSKLNLTGNRMLSMNRVDVAQIPLSGAIVVGKKDAKRRIIVFDDPNCPHCAKLHQTAKEIVAKHPDIAFYVKPFPRNGNDAQTYEKALSIVCAGTVQALEDAFAGKPLPKGECGSKAVKETSQVADRLKIRSTPTMVFPDGRVVPGALDADMILTLLADDGGSAKGAAPGGGKEQGKKAEKASGKAPAEATKK